MGVSRSTAFARQAQRRAVAGSPAGVQGAGRVPATPRPPPARPEGSPLDRLRAYAAGDPEALSALDALLAPPEEGLGRDELQALRDGLVLAAGLVRDAAKDRKGGEEGDDGRLLRALQRLEGLGKTVATVKAKRPEEPKVDEVTRRLVERRDAAIERIGLLTSETAVKFAGARAELQAWLGTLGPIGAEVDRRVGAMLGEAT